MPLIPIVAALLVFTVGMSVLAAPRPPHAPPRLTMTGNLPAMVTLAPVVVARIRGDR